jgi:hypothetical protein
MTWGWLRINKGKRHLAEVSSHNSSITSFRPRPGSKVSSHNSSITSFRPRPGSKGMLSTLAQWAVQPMSTGGSDTILCLLIW